MSKTTFINIMITKECNFNCHYCYVKHSNSDNAEMDNSTIENVIEFIKRRQASNDEIRINFLGGGPLLRFNEIKRIMEEMSKSFSNISYGITTNGSLLNDERINFLADNFSFNLTISIDGIKEQQEKHRIRNFGLDYDQMISCSKQLLKLRPNLRIRSTIKRDSIDKISENLIYLIENGFKIIVPCLDVYEKDFKQEDIHVIAKELYKVKEYINSNMINDVFIYSLSNEFKCLNRCNAGENYFTIDTTGDLYPCGILVGRKEWIIGNISLGFNQDKLKKLKIINNKIVEKCKGCEVYEYCESTRCLLINYATEGDYYEPNQTNCIMMNCKNNVNS